MRGGRERSRGRQQRGGSGGIERSRRSGGQRGRSGGSDSGGTQAQQPQRRPAATPRGAPAAPRRRRHRGHVAKRGQRGRDRTPVASTCYADGVRAHGAVGRVSQDALRRGRVAGTRLRSARSASGVPWRRRSVLRLARQGVCGGGACECARVLRRRLSKPRLLAPFSPN